MRDAALLIVAMRTGRRLSDLTGMRWGDLTIPGTGVAIAFPLAKGAQF